MAPESELDDEGDRRQLLRRDEDAVLYHRVAQMEHNLTALAAGPTLAQLEKLDLRYQPRAELISTFATNEDLQGVGDELARVLKRDYMTRDQMRNEYVPREEHRQRFDWMRNIALLVLTFAATIEPILLHH